MKTITAPASTNEIIVSLDAKQIHISEHNTRQPTLKEVQASGLVDSMRVTGQITPGIGRPHPTLGKGHVELAAGARRSVAAKFLELPFKVVVREMADAEFLDIILTENLQREDPDPEQEAKLIELRLAEGITPAEICARYGKSELWIKRRMKLLEIIPEIRKLMVPGKQLDHFTTGMKERLGACSKEVQKELLKSQALHYANTEEELKSRMQRQSRSLKGAKWLSDPDTCIPGCGPGCATDTKAGLFPEDGDPCGTCVNALCFKKREALAINKAIAAALDGYNISDIVLFRKQGYQEVPYQGKPLKMLDEWDFQKHYTLAKKVTATFGLDLTNPTAPKLVSLDKVSKDKAGSTSSPGKKESREDKLTGKRLALINARLVAQIEMAALPTTVPILNIVAAFGLSVGRGTCQSKDDHTKVWESLESLGKVIDFANNSKALVTREEALWQKVKPLLKTRLFFHKNGDLLIPWQRDEMKRLADLTGFNYETEWLAVCAAVPVPKSWGPGIDPVTLKPISAVQKLEKSTKPADPAKKTVKKAAEKPAKSAHAGFRYTEAQKEVVVKFATEFNALNGKGGQSKAAEKFGVSQLTVASWLKAAQKA